MRFVLIMLVLGGVLCFVGYEEWKLSRVTSTEPQTISAEKLAQNGPGSNAHVVVTDFVLGDNFVCRSRKNSSTWNEVWVPVIPLTDELIKKVAAAGNDPTKLPAELSSPDNLRLILKSSKIHNDGDLTRFGDQHSFRGMVINEIDSIGSEENRLLTQQYPKTDFKKCWIIEVDREPAGAGKIFGFLGAGLACIAVGIIVPLASRSGDQRDPDMQHGED